MKTFQLEYGTFITFNQDLVNQSYLKKGKIPSQDIIEKHLQKYISDASSIVMLGSNMGILEIYFTKINPGINIYTFEPREKQFCLLAKNITMNNVENVVMINNALGHLTGTINLDYKSKNDVVCDEQDLVQLGNGALIGYNNYFHIVTLDSLKLLACDIIYIDLQGFEYIALAGGLNTIKKYKPVIYFKRDSDTSHMIMSHFGLQNRNIEELLNQLNYETQYVDSDTIIAKWKTQGSYKKETKISSYENLDLLQGEKVESLIEMTY